MAGDGCAGAKARASGRHSLPVAVSPLGWAAGRGRFPTAKKAQNMNSAAILSARANPARWLWIRLAFALALAALADWLFFDRRLGLSWPLFLALLVSVALFANPLRAKERTKYVAFGLFALTLAALVEEVSALSLSLSLAATGFVALWLAMGDVDDWRRRLAQATWMVVVGPFRFIGDALRASRLAQRRHKGLVRIAPLGWILPALLFCLFLWLFAEANPVIESWLASFDYKYFLNLLLSPHPLFWIAMMCMVWPMLRLHVKRKSPEVLSGPRPTARAKSPDDILGPTAFLRTLVMLNALFALQTTMDLVYLWGGVALPHGMTYAAYAHRGAYPLVLTALLAAALVLFAMRSGGPAEASKLIRPLVLAFTGQNILLVLSSLLRLNLYVAAYSLTYLRAAAFIWFLLVAFGLATIVWRILREKRSSWLVDVNAAALAAALYLCCFVNFPLLIANYNFDHSFENVGSGPHLDRCYLISELGPQAIPAIDRVGWPQEGCTGKKIREWLASRVAFDDWRTWSFRDFRLRRYLADHAEPQ